MSQYLLSFTNSAATKSDFYFLYEYDTGRFLPETAALDPNILSDTIEFIAVILFDGKMLALGHVCLCPRVIAVGCSYCNAKRVYF